MGLFSRKPKPAEGVFSVRELEFNRQKLQTAIVKLSEDLYAYRADESHRIFADYLRYLLNLEVLQLSEGKLDQADIAYKRGRIDSLRHALNLREKFILDKKVMRDERDPTSQESKRSYVRPPATQAGLSI